MPELSRARKCSLLAATVMLSWSAMVASDYVFENGEFDVRPA